MNTETSHPVVVNVNSLPPGVTYPVEVFCIHFALLSHRGNAYNAMVDSFGGPKAIPYGTLSKTNSNVAKYRAEYLARTLNTEQLQDRVKFYSFFANPNPTFEHASLAMWARDYTKYTAWELTPFQATYALRLAYHGVKTRAIDEAVRVFGEDVPPNTNAQVKKPAVEAYADFLRMTFGITTPIAKRGKNALRAVPDKALEGTLASTYEPLYPGLTDKQEVFCWRLALHGIKVRAYREAYGAAGASAAQGGVKLARQERIAARVHQLVALHKEGNLNLYNGPWKYYPADRNVPGMADPEMVRPSCLSNYAPLAVKYQDSQSA